MYYAQFLALLLAVSSCISLFDKEDKVPLDIGNKEPLFIEQLDEEVDGSAFILNIPEANYGANSINKKIDDIYHYKEFELDRGNIISAISIDEKIFLLHDSGDLYCVDINGQKIWHKDITSSGKHGFISNVNGMLLITTGTTRVYGVNPKNGDIIWKKSLKAPVRSKGIDINGRRFAVMTIDNYLYVLNSKDGTLEWSHQAPISTLKKLNFSSPIFYDDKLILPPISDEVVVLDSNNGKVIWSRDLDTELNQVNSLIFYKLDDSPIVLGNVVIVSNNIGKVEAFDLKTGERKWKKRALFKGNPYIVGEMLFILTEDEKFLAMDSYGKFKWKRSYLDDDRTFYDPILINDHLWLFTDKGKALGYNPENGELVNEAIIPEGIILKPFIVGNALCSFTKSGNLVVIGGNFV